MNYYDVKQLMPFEVVQENLYDGIFGFVSSCLPL